MVPLKSIVRYEKVKSVPEIFFKRVEKSYGKIAYKYKSDKWYEVSWGKFGDYVLSVATKLIKDGFKKGEKGAIIGETRPEWCISDLAILSAGGISIGIYHTMSHQQIEYILNHSESKVLFVQNEEQLEKILKIRKSIPVEKIVVWEIKPHLRKMMKEIGVEEFKSYLEEERDKKLVFERMEEISPEDVAIIIYTSGTTGPPKGAMITHKNIISLLEAWEEEIPLYEGDISYHFLPMAHGAERVVGFYGRINMGLQAVFATSIKAVVDEIKEVKPTLFGAVPRIFEKAYSRIKEEVEKLPQRRKRIFYWAENVGREYIKTYFEKKKVPLPLKLKYLLAYNIVLRRIKEAFGGRVRYFITGAAPIPVEILEFMWACGLPIYEVYGLTEATVVTHANRPGEVKLGTVGKPIKIIQQKIAEDGEILLKGPTIFKGYYKDEKATKEAIDEDGWLHTGDIGEIDEEGFLKIKDRKKHIIITSGGKNVSPAEIENTIKAQDILISQVFVFGDMKPYLVALITLNPAELISFALQKNLIDEEKKEKAQKILEYLQENPLGRPEGIDELTAELSNHPAVYERIKSAVEKGNSLLSRVEQIKKFAILSRDFYIEEGEITPTLKVKRKEVSQKYMHIIEKLYD